jgi:hypothetical protein
VSRGGRGVGVGRKVMEFCGSIVRALWHGVSPLHPGAVMGECICPTVYRGLRCALIASLMSLHLSRTAPSASTSRVYAGYSML